MKKAIATTKAPGAIGPYSQAIDAGAFVFISGQIPVNPETGNIPERDMFNTYNMGVGMSIVVSAEDAEKALEVLKANGEDAYVMGEIVKGDEGVILW